MRSLLLTLTALWLLSMFGGRASADERDAPVSFAEAQQNFRLQKYKETYRQLKVLLQRDPKDKDALMLMGALYYQNQSMRKARAYFDRADPPALSNDTAFAYASVYFHYEDYKKAILGYRYVVKNRAPFRTFSLYYLGVSYYKMGQWSRSRRFFQNVDPKDLPQFMQNNRKAYLADIRRQQEKMLEHVIGATSNQSLKQPTLVEQFEASVARDKEREKDKELSEEEFETPRIDMRNPDKMEAPKGFVSTWRPSLAFLQEVTNLDNFGLNHDSTNVIAHREAVEANVGYNQSQWATYLRMEAGNISYDANIQETLLFQLEQTTGTFTTERERKQRLDTGFARFEAVGSSNLVDSLRLEVLGGYQAFLPRFQSKDLWGEALGQADLVYTQQEFEASLQVKVTMPQDEATHSSAQDIEVRADLDKEWGDFRFTLAAYQWQTSNPSLKTSDRFRLLLVDPALRYRTGYTSELGGSGSIAYTWGETVLALKAMGWSRASKDGKGISRLSKGDEIDSVALSSAQTQVSLQAPLWETFILSSTVGFQQLGNYVFRDYDENGNLTKTYETDVQEVLFQFGASVPLTNWLHLSGRYSLTSNEYSGTDVSAKEFRRSNPDRTMGSWLLLELSKTL